MAKHVNGIDVEALGAVVQAVKDQPEMGRCVFRVSNQWQGGTNNRATVQGFYGALEEHPDRACQREFEIDEPPVLLGQDRGPNPVEYVLIALSG